MYKNIWQKSCRSVCSINIISSSNIILLSISGFRFGNQIITDDMIYDVKEAEKILIEFFKEDGNTVYSSLKMDYHEFLKLLPRKREFDRLGFVLIPAEFKEFEKVPSLSLCKSCESQIGMSIAVIGHQIEHNNMAIKTGIISSSFKNSKGHSFIQYDGTVIPGFSGSPLLDASSGDVLGVIMNKEMGFVKSYKELMDIIDLNLKTLKLQEGKTNFLDLDISQVLSANQNQMKHIVKEFFLNATVRVGFALEIGHVVEYLESRMDIDSEQRTFCN